MSGGGAGARQDKMHNKQRDIAYKQALNDHKYAWDNAQRGYNHQVLQNSVARYNQEATLGYQEATQKQAWTHQMQIREMQYNSDMAAYNKSEKLYGAQIEYNQVAAQLASENEYNVSKERYTDLAFKAAEASLEFETKRYSAQTQLNTNRAKSSFDSQSNTIKKIQALGQANARGTEGRTARKQIQSVIASADINQAAIYDALTRSEGAFNEALAGLDSSFVLGRGRRHEEQLSIARSHEAAKKKITHDLYGANLRADANRLSMPSMGPALPKPLEMPRAIIMDPMLPINSKKPLKGAGSGGVGAAQDHSKMMSGIGTIAGAAMAATPFFGPLAIPIMAGLGGLL